MFSAIPSGPPENALKRLMDGNERFITGNMMHPNQNMNARKQILSGQHPFAAILGCSDSRIPPEIIFDVGLGDLFIVRVAGNIVSEEVAGTLEYAVLKLRIPLIMILGHSDCGAVKATLENQIPTRHIASITSIIRNSVTTPLQQKTIEPTTRAHAKRMADRLSDISQIINQLVLEKKLAIIPGFYDLSTGMIELL